MNMSALEVKNTTAVGKTSLLEGFDLDKLWKLSETLAKADIVPTHFTGKPANVFLVLQLAHSLGLSPFVALQNVHVINGRPGLSTALLMSLAADRGVFADKISFETNGVGQNLSVTASATLACSRRMVSATVSMEMAMSEGWVSRNPKYKSMPEHMLKYRAATFLIRENCPELLMGMHTTDEVTDTDGADKRKIRASKSSVVVFGDETKQDGDDAIEAEVV